VNRNRSSQDSPGEGRLQAALDALRLVAEADPDHARDANGRGFAKSDVRRGHSLATASASSLGASAAADAVRMAVRYRRQVPTSIRFGLGLTDQPDLFD
jgi:hypothetical protein